MRKVEDYRSFHEEQAGRYLEGGRGNDEQERPRFRLAADGTLVINGNGHHRMAAYAQGSGKGKAIDDALLRIDLADLIDSKDWRGRYLAEVQWGRTFDTADQLGPTEEERSWLPNVKAAGARDNGWTPRRDPEPR